jgi:hypothetical protein
MLKKLAASAIVAIFILSIAGICSAGSEIDQPTAQPMEKTKDRLSRGMNNIFYGQIEVPKNIDETKTKGTKVERCSEKTRSGVERGIARTIAGLWQVATFWYSDPECVTSSAPQTTTASTTK